ncbi:MAG TPA: ABC transporter transmembrane domain-containing protein [Desulfomonilaceae bacterium]|nr:ABC transporter transmembrane domain-containing protein [Desulfomonilaceae bacterium]
MITNKPLFSWVLERYRGLQVLLIVLILVATLLRVFPLEMQKRIVNWAIALKKMDALFLYCGLYLGAVILAGLFKYVINVLQGYIGQKILFEMRAQIYNHILSLPLPFFRRTAPGMVIASLTSELSSIGEFMGGAIAVPIINILTLLSFAAYMAYLDPLLALLSFSIYPVEVLIIPVLQKRLNRHNRDRIDVTRTMSNVIGEAISGMHEIQGNAGYELENSKLARFSSRLVDIRLLMNKFKFLTKFANNFFQSLGPFILFIVGGYLIMQGRFDLGSLVAFLSAYERLSDPWKELMDYYQDYQDSKVRYYQIMKAFDVKPEFQLSPKPDREPLNLVGNIEVKELSFLVDGRTRILDQISLTLNAGKQLALVGPSGSGKSTLAMVLGQLYKYNTGHVLIDGLEMRNLTRMDASHNIGYVAQYPFIFDGTILENLLYACQSLNHNAPESKLPIPGREEIFLVLDSIGFSEDVLAMGLNTHLSPDRHSELARKLITVRESFFRCWGSDLASLVDFLDVNQFQYHASIAENIVFGHPNRSSYELEALPTNGLFEGFLKRADLRGELLRLGEKLAKSTVALLKGLEQDDFFFNMSPISADEFDSFSEIVDRLSRSGSEPIPREVEDALLGLALRFNPSLHKMVSLSPELERRLLQARNQFMQIINDEDPGAVSFYEPTEYSYAHSVLQNVIAGYLRMEQPQTSERIQQNVIDLLAEAALLDDVKEVGLEFQVGSKGDRLSGGQKQKLGIARALLKKPNILILDEATASLDNTSQAKIEHLLHAELKGNSTIIAVVHRLDMVRDFDVIAVMKAGRIVEMGKYEELLKRKGLFYELAVGCK